MIRESAKTAFWNEVESCLVSLFHCSKEDAHQKTEKLQENLKNMPVGDVFYHSEPFDVACDISGTKPTDDVRDNYFKMREESEW
jgi:hypothetical protein